MSMSKHVAIVGGGVVGLCTGHYLARAGHRVTILDRDPEQNESCSAKNAGMVVPSHFIPLAAPGVISQGLRWMLNPLSPFYLRPRLDPKFWLWCLQFFRHSNRRHVAASELLLRDLSLASRALFLELAEEFDFSLETRGLAMLCRTQHGLDEEAKVAVRANEIGIEAEVCDPVRLRELDPSVTMDAMGGVWFPQDCHLNPATFLEGLRTSIRKNGGQILNHDITHLDGGSGKLRAVIADDGERFDADAFVLSGGIWTPEISRHLGLSIPMQGGKGYSMTLKEPRELPQLCSLLKEGRVAVTPMGKELRIAGTMEICGDDFSPSPKRIRSIVTNFCRFFPEFVPEDFDYLKVWSGLRPCTPDGLPYLGIAPRFGNTVVSTGHSMLGLSLGPISGQLTAGLIDGTVSETGIDLRMLAPGRFG